MFGGYLELSVFIDESGDTGTDSRFYLLTFVFHNQRTPLTAPIEKYESRLKNAELPDIPFHMEPLISGDKDYGSISISSSSSIE